MILISIHAPAKGATFRMAYGINLFEISIHAPAKGATIFFARQSFIIFYFNPRSREGSDAPRLTIPNQPQISIHAPAKGATEFTNI